MPRKVNYGLDYDDGYNDDDDYEYYDDDDDYGVDRNGAEENAKKQNLWRCHICTYDNEESFSACDICGVLRNPTSGNYINSEKKSVDGRCRDTGVSKMAKSLFASLPNQTPEKTVVGQLRDSGIWMQGGNDVHKQGNFQQNVTEFHKAIRSHSYSNIDIAPFKFDVPSPDDLVSNGLRSYKRGAQAKSSSFLEKTGAANVQSTAKKSDSSISKEGTPVVRTTKGKQLGEVESSNSVNGVTSIQSSSEKSYNSSLSKKETPEAQTSGVKSDSLSVSMQKGKQKILDDSSSTAINEGNSDSLTGGLQNISLSKKSGNANNSKTRRANTHTQYKPDTWMLPDKAEDALTQLNLAIVGHVDSGKSTLSGRLLHLLGQITQKEMHKYEKEAKSSGKGSFAYAWALDESPEERERGITMTVAVAYFDTKRYHVVVLDSPGHKDFVPNMISGATQADAAILVIDASIGAFEAGMDTKGQTREHAQLIRSFGVDQIIVAVNKMDVVEYSEDRFNLIKTQLRIFLRSCNFKDSSVSWIPLSAMENQNLVAAPTDVRFTSWYHGPYLLDAVDSLQPPTREFAKPLRMPICDVIKSSSQGQVSACGKVESGALCNGLKVLVMPSGDVGTICSLKRDSQVCTVARAGDNVAVALQGFDGSQVMAGGVLCHPDFPVAEAKHLELRVLVLDGGTPILVGSQLEFHIHHAKEAGRVVKIVSLLDPKTGKVTKKTPRCLTAKQTAVLEVVLNGYVCVEEFTNCRALGRVFLRALGRTIAVGIVTRIIDNQE